MRRYPSVNWVCSEATYKMGRDSENNMFMKLFRYISGANVEQEKVDMTIRADKDEDAGEQDGEQ